MRRLRLLVWDFRYQILFDTGVWAVLSYAMGSIVLGFVGLWLCYLVGAVRLQLDKRARKARTQALVRRFLKGRRGVWSAPTSTREEAP